MKTGNLVSDYLGRWAEPVQGIAARVPGRFTHVLVVPALAESAALLDGYAAAAGAASGRVLCIVVVNASEDAEPAAFEHNARLLLELRGRLRDPRLVHEAPPAWFGSEQGFDVLVVDRTSAGFRLPRRQGVGLARRIGCDLASALSAQKSFDGRYIACTDADAVLPADYFPRIDAARSENASALVFPFRHEPSGAESVDLATELYDLSLRYYVLGLTWAGSPYAFQTLGSSIAVDVDAYAKVRGFPRLRAGEDFYVLCKLAKIAPILRIEGDPIRIISRRSGRVPFGTGAGVRKLEGRELFVYAPRSFAILRAWLRCLEAFAAARDLERARMVLMELAPGERAALDKALDHFDVQRALHEASRHTPGPGLLRRLHTWFDGFRTLKVIHALRESLHSDVPLSEALASAEFLASARPSSGGPDSLIRALAELEQAAPPLVGPTLLA